ncbi:MAG: hypothetical protein LE168_00405 [Endomicrobium sp.]|nr:hypothetical protein [Endomicrobium sp.]
MEITKIRNSKILQSGKLKLAALSLLIITTIFLLCRRIINFNLINLYENKTVLINAFKNNVSFGKYQTPFYRPTLTISLAIDNKIAGESENFEYFVNILLHCISAILILLFLSKYIFDLRLSALATLLFAIHTVAVHTVARIPGKNDSLYFIYFMLSFMFFTEYIDKRKIYIFVISLFWLPACYFTKESEISIPFIFLFYYYTYKHKNSSSLPVSAYVLWILNILFFLIMRISVFPSSVNFISTIINELKISNLYLFLNHISATLFLQISMTVNLTRKIFILGIISILILLSFGLYKKISRKENNLYFDYFLLSLFSQQTL